MRRFLFWTVMAFSVADPAQAAWSTSSLAHSTLAGGSSGRRAAQCDLAVRPDGGMLATYVTRTGQGIRGSSRPPHVETGFVAERSRAGAWSTPRVVFRHTVGVKGKIVSSGIYAYCPRIALGPGRSADVIWSEHKETPFDAANSNNVSSGPPALHRMSRSRSGAWSAGSVWIKNAALDDIISSGSHSLVRLRRYANKRWGPYVVVARKADGSFTAPQTVADKHTEPTGWAIGANGHAALLIKARRKIDRAATWQVRTVAPGGKWSVLGTVPHTPAGCLFGDGAPRIAVSDAGTIALAGPCRDNNHGKGPGFVGESVAVRDTSGAWRFGETDRETTGTYADRTYTPTALVLLESVSVTFTSRGSVLVAWTRAGRPEPIAPALPPAEVHSAEFAGDTLVPSSSATVAQLDPEARLESAAFASTGAGAILATGGDGRLVSITRSAPGVWSAPERRDTTRNGAGQSGWNMPAVVHADGGVIAALFSSHNTKGVQVAITR